MPRRILAVAALTVVGTALLATPASAGVTITTEANNCMHVYYGEKDLTFNGLCYLGPPTPELP
jgi:hypothetical protein